MNGCDVTVQHFCRSLCIVVMEVVGKDSSNTSLSYIESPMLPSPSNKVSAMAF